MAYNGVKSKCLKFKGDDEYIKKRKRKEKKKDDEACDANKDEEEGGDAPVIPGSGRIVASKDVIHGLETKFKEEVCVGDAIFVQHPNTHQMESRLVTAILSQRSLNILDSFSSDFSSTTAYHIKKDSIIMERLAKLEKLQGEEEISEEEWMRRRMAKILEKKMKKQKKVIKVQEKVYGGGGVSYRSVEKKMDRTMSVEDALDERCKLGRDKHCW